MSMEDVQSRPDERGVALDAVGVSGLRYPVSVAERERGKQETIAGFTMSVDLAHTVKGTHLSRFVQLLHEYAGEVTVYTLPLMAEALRERLDSACARVEADFPFFVERAAPISGARSLLECRARLTATAQGEDTHSTLGVTVPVTSVCPCSKAISDYGAHNQRGHITIEVRLIPGQGEELGALCAEDLIEVAERSASSPVYPLLKRPDERFVTMAAHDNPVFVEDMARNVVKALQNDPRIAAVQIEVSNEESIHNHAAFARVEWPHLGALESSATPGTQGPRP
jgi:GTP cyclohydrolase IB